MELRDLPSVDELAREAGDPLAVDAARAVIDRAREEIQAGADPGDLAARLREELADARRPRLRRVLNATGVVVHTNLGRAPLAEEALARVVEAARGYSNLEYDLAEGARGSRQDHVAAILRRLTGAEAALVVNNNAAAVLLALAALAEGREVVVSRGELIEIGDGFRIPDVLARSGARLVEVGTTNRTRAADYERAIGPETARPPARPPVELPRRRLRGAAAARGGRRGRAPPRPPARRRPRLGHVASTTVTRSGRADRARVARGRRRPRLLLGRQAARRPAGRDRRSAARSSSSGCAAIRSSARCASTSSRSRRSRGRSCSTSRRRSGSPSCACSRRSAAAVRARAERLAAATGGEVEETVGRVGGGALPLAELPSFACALEESLAAPLRAGEPPVVGVVRDGRLLLDCLTLTDEEADEAAAAVARPRVSELARGGSGTSCAARSMTRALALVADARRRRTRSPTARGRADSREPGADADTLHRLLRALASDGVFARDGAGRLRQHRGVGAPAASPAGTTSRTSSAASGFERSADLDASTAARRSRSVRRRLLGVARASTRRERAPSTARWRRARQSRLERLEPLDWRGDETVVDVGGGNGSLLAALLERHPELRGIVLDLPETVRDEAAFGDRLEFVEGSFFESRAAGRRLRPLDDPPRLARRGRGGGSCARSARGRARDARLVLIDESVIRAGQRARRREVARPADARPRRRARARRRSSGARCSSGAGFEPVALERGLIEAHMPLTVGTAGHIDHGKTALVEALTGKNTDRLPEEHERGISIDLGYAPLELPDGTQPLRRRRPGPRALRPHDGRRARAASTSSCS